jgi:hypothetical protein
MPLAKTSFLERMASLHRSTLSDAVTNRVLTDRAHNDVARMLRNGLAVVGFAALEDFIKLRTSEVLEEIGTFGVPFAELPEKLQCATTYEAVNALAFQLGHMDKSLRTAYIQDHAAKIASTATSAWELTPHALGYSKSNLNDETIKAILKNFLIDDAWGQMTRVGARLNLVSLPLDETFRNAALRRHKAAHTAQADTPQTDLRQYVKEALAIAIAFDGLLRKAVNHLRTRNIGYLMARTKIRSTHVTIRTVSQVQGALERNGRRPSQSTSR